MIKKYAWVIWISYKCTLWSIFGPLLCLKFANTLFTRICREFEKWCNLRVLSGKFLRQKSCYPESFCLFWLCIYRLSQKITPIKCLKNKLMLYFRANWTTDLDHLAPHKNILDQLGRFGPLRTSCCCSKLVINCQMVLFLKISGRKRCTYTNVNTITNTDETNSK